MSRMADYLMSVFLLIFSIILLWAQVDAQSKTFIDPDRQSCERRERKKKIIKSKLHLSFSLQAQFTTEILARAITCLGSLLTRGLRLVVLTGSLPGSKLAITAGGSAWTQFLLTLGPSMKPLLASSKTVMNRTIVENSPGQ